MKNGDRISGAIVKKDEKTLTIKSAHFGVVTLPWDQVASAKADTPINIVMPSGQTVTGTLNVEPDKVEVTAGGATRAVPPADIVALRDSAEQKAYERLLKPRLLDLWLGNANIGWAGTKGNAETATLSLGMAAARVTRTDKMSVYFNAIRASALIDNVSAQTAQAIRGGLAYNRNIHPRVFLNLFNDWETDKFQNLDLRTVVGGGLGYHAWKAEHGRFDLLGGVAYNRERYDPVRPLLPFTRNGADGYFGDDFSYKVGARTSLIQSFRMFTNLQDSTRYRVNFDVGATTQITKWLTWNLSLSDRFLNLPVTGRKKNDILYSTGFGFAFAR
jgi:putative salt-induced outer membrane protein YdiY